MRSDTRPPLMIRAATEADIPTLRQFEQDLINVEREFDPDLRPEGVTYYDLEGLIHSDESDVLVAESEGSLQASGYVQIRDAKPIYHHTQIAYVGFLYVVPSARGQGLVQLIVDALRVWAEARGLSHMELGVYSANAAAISAYRRAGFESIAETMVLRLAD